MSKTPMTAVTRYRRLLNELEVEETVTLEKVPRSLQRRKAIAKAALVNGALATLEKLEHQRRTR